MKELILEEKPDAKLDTKIDIIKECLLTDIKKYSDDVAEKNSVLKYGGFYIGRYEVGNGNNGDNKAVKKGTRPKTNVSFETAKTEAESIYNNNSNYGVKSALPSGAAWDRVLGWIVSTGAKSESAVYFNSKSWGNFKRSWNSNATLYNTGYRSTNNIFVLAGNVEEMSMEWKILMHVTIIHSIDNFFIV